jgi:hypothetical protein
MPERELWHALLAVTHQLAAKVRGIENSDIYNATKRLRNRIKPKSMQIGDRLILKLFDEIVGTIVTDQTKKLRMSLYVLSPNSIDLTKVKQDFTPNDTDSLIKVINQYWTDENIAILELIVAFSKEVITALGSQDLPAVTTTNPATVTITMGSSVHVLHTDYRTRTVRLQATTVPLDHINTLAQLIIQPR